MGSESHRYAAGGGFVEVADRVFVGRYPQWDTTIGVVVASDGVLVVDTRASVLHGAELRDDVRRLTGQGDREGEIRWVVNTHQHFDHAMGNLAFEGATIHAHENAAAEMVAAGDRIKNQIRADPSLDPDHPAITAAVLDAVLASDYRLPDVTFSSVATIDLGDRYVELVHPGRGHTNGDLVMSVPDVDVAFGGDLIEQSADPAFGSDCFPLEWAGSLDLMIGMLTERSVVVPGHGTPVDKTFVQDQRADIADVGQLVRSLFSQGVAREDALEVGGSTWPYPAHQLRHAVSRGYDQLMAEAAAGTGGPAAGRQPAQPPAGSAPLPLL
jgi:glyoxylase-like metal-dependent hydrolase (beta-lactamase superfamily II)